MHSFSAALQQKLQTLLPFSQLEISLNHPFFKLQKGNVSQYLQEIVQTGEILKNQTQSEYAEIYAQKLVQQFDALQKAIKQQNKPQSQTATFRTNYRFPKNIHNLPTEKRLIEYRKALRLFNEKLTWLMEQAQLATEEKRHIYIAQITETEYRKTKCVMEIDRLEGNKS